MALLPSDQEEQVREIVRMEVSRYAGLLAAEMVRGPEPVPGGAAPSHQLYTSALERFLRGEVPTLP